MECDMNTVLGFVDHLGDATVVSQPHASEDKLDATGVSLQTTVVEQVLTVKAAHTAGKATADDSPILQAAIGLGEQIQAASVEIEQGRRIPISIVAAMKEAGVFGMAMPRAWGGPE